MIKIYLLLLCLFTSFTALAEENPFERYRTLTEEIEKQEVEKKERDKMYEQLLLKCVSFMKYEVPADKAISGCDCAVQGLLNATKNKKDDLIALMITPRMLYNMLKQETYYCLSTGNKPYEGQ